MAIMMMITSLLKKIFDTLFIIINNTTITTVEMRWSPLEVEIIVEEKYSR
jgi:hypothetical protein